MIYFLWAFLFGAFGVSMMVTSFRSSYRPILKFTSGVLGLCAGLWSISKVDMPMKYNYGKKIVHYVQHVANAGMGKIKGYFDKYT